MYRNVQTIYDSDPDPHRHEDREPMLFRITAEVIIPAFSEDEAWDEFAANQPWPVRYITIEEYESLR